MVGGNYISEVTGCTAGCLQVNSLALCPAKWSTRLLTFAGIQLLAGAKQAQSSRRGHQHTRLSVLPSGCPAGPLPRVCAGRGQSPGFPRPRGPQAQLPASGLPEWEESKGVRERKRQRRESLPCRTKAGPVLPWLPGEQQLELDL